MARRIWKWSKLTAKEKKKKGNKSDLLNLVLLLEYPYLCTYPPIPKAPGSGALYLPEQLSTLEGIHKGICSTFHFFPSTHIVHLKPFLHTTLLDGALQSCCFTLHPTSAWLLHASLHQDRSTMHDLASKSHGHPPLLWLVHSLNYPFHASLFYAHSALSSQALNTRVCQAFVLQPFSCHGFQRLQWPSN